MKRLVSFLFVAVLMVDCVATYYDPEGNPVLKEKMAQLRSAAVEAHLAGHRYRIFADCMYPMCGPAVCSQDDRGLGVSGDSAGLFLLYFGKAYYIPYGCGGGLDLVESLTSYREESMKGGCRIFMTTRNNFESYQIILEVFDSATISLVINPSEKETISFSGVVGLNNASTPKGQKASKKRQATLMKLQLTDLIPCSCYCS